MSRCLTIDNKHRPSAKELLLDPFIISNIVDPTTKKQYGRAILKQLVADSISEIEEFRQQRQEDSDDDDKG